MNELTTQRNTTEAAIKHALVTGDVSRLTAVERVKLYFAVCDRLKLDPLSFPFDYIKTRDGGLKLYPNAIAASQIRKRDKINVRLTNRQFSHGMIIVTAEAIAPDGRIEQATGAVSGTDKYGNPLTGQAQCDALMKAETKAKRRVTLSISGIGWNPDDEGGKIVTARAFDPPLDTIEDF